MRYHCHFTGKSRRAAHYKCNLQFIFHNLAGYDSHLLVKNLGKTEGNIKYIPNNEEKYISFSKDVVVDCSKLFIASSLNSFNLKVANLSHDKLKETMGNFKGKIDLISQKGVYPYDYTSSIEKFNATELPSKEEFYPKRNDCDI